MRKFYWYLTAYFKKYGLILLASIIGAILFFSLVISVIFPKIKLTKHEYIGLIGLYSLDNLPLEVQEILSKGLTKIKEDGSVEPLLASRWSVEQEGLSYRFILKENLLWNDGKKVETKDINYQFPNVETIITPNDIVFKLPTPFSPFPTKLATPVFRKGELVRFKFLKKPTLIGISPYKIVNYEKRGNFIKKVDISGPEKNLTYRFYPTENEAVKAFKAGEVDILPDLANRYEIFDWPTVKVKENIQYNQYLALFFNFNDPRFTKNVRQAFSYAIEKDYGQLRAIGPISPLSWAYFDGVKKYNKNETKAVDNLLEELPHEPMEFELTTTTLFVSEAEKIKKDLETTGKKAALECRQSKKVKDEDKGLCDNLKIKIKIYINNFPDKQNFQLLLIGQESPPDPDQYALWHSDEPTNFTNYKNVRIDSLLEKGRQITNTKERTKIYQEFQQFLLEDPPAVFLRYLIRYDVRRK